MQMKSEGKHTVKAASSKDSTGITGDERHGMGQVASRSNAEGAGSTSRINISFTEYLQLVPELVYQAQQKVFTTVNKTEVFTAVSRFLDNLNQLQDLPNLMFSRYQILNRLEAIHKALSKFDQSLSDVNCLVLKCQKIIAKLKAIRMKKVLHQLTIGLYEDRQFSFTRVFKQADIRPKTR